MNISTIKETLDAEEIDPSRLLDSAVYALSPFSRPIHTWRDAPKDLFTFGQLPAEHAQYGKFTVSPDGTDSLAS